jgi:ribulose-5-phosphate 4-epimerase/fuculose-1-phosphate aldolase
MSSASATPQAQSAAPQDPVWQAKVHLAAALRLAVLHDFDEGIDNHFTVAVPGREDQYLISPFGVHWSEACASTMMVFNEAGETLEGSGVVELSAQSIHAPVHRLTGAKVVCTPTSPGPWL